MIQNKQTEKHNENFIVSHTSPVSEQEWDSHRGLHFYLDHMPWWMYFGWFEACPAWPDNTPNIPFDMIDAIGLPQIFPISLLCRFPSRTCVNGGFTSTERVWIFDHKSQGKCSERLPLNFLNITKDQIESLKREL